MLVGSAGLQVPDVVCFLKQGLVLAPWDWVGQECRDPVRWDPGVQGQEQLG